MDSSTSEIGHLHYCKSGFQSKIKNRTANSVDPDEMAHMSHLIWIYTVSKGISVGLQG